MIPMSPIPNLFEVIIQVMLSFGFRYNELNISSLFLN
jgi:hypothetical protein